MRPERRRRRRSPSRPNATAILTADIHLTDSRPPARTDDYRKAQEKKLAEIQRLSDVNGGCPILCAGDVFHAWRSSPWLLAWAYRHLPRPIIGIPGNHDLPAHSMQNYDRSALHVLDITMPEMTIITEDPAVVELSGRRILLLHQLVWPSDYKSLQSLAGGTMAQDLLRKYDGEYDLILVGDNHTPFTARGRRSLLVNPGSTMRRTADQADHRPRCYLYYAEDNSVVPAYLPIEEGVISREHLDKKQERDDRISAYIERMETDWKLGLSYRQNLEAFFAANNTPKRVEELVWEHFDKNN